MAKRSIIAGFIVIAVCANVFAILGPPTAELKQGAWSGGFNYSYTHQGLDKTTAKWTEYDDGILTDSGSEKLKLKDGALNMYYGNLGYGIEDWWQAYIQLGAANFTVKGEGEGDFYDYDRQTFDFDTAFAWGWGTKITFAKQDKVDWGVGVQMNWLNTKYDKSYSGSWDDGEEDYGTWAGKTKINLNAYNLFVAVGPTVDMGGWKLYGGPFYTYISGDISGRYNETGVDTGEPYTYMEKGKADVKANDHIGGYIGAQFSLAQNVDMVTEFSATGKSWGLGTGITWKF